jgi:hypothetical protein
MNSDCLEIDSNDYALTTKKNAGLDFSSPAFTTFSN